MSVYMSKKGSETTNVFYLSRNLFVLESSTPDETFKY